MARRGGAFWRALPFVMLGTVALAWPALLNGYPLTFGDTGVYLLDGVTRHVSWPRPFFYGLAILPLHLGRSAWPIVAAQAFVAACFLRLVLTRFLPGSGETFRYLVLAAVAVATSLPWFTAQIMPDAFGPLIVMAMALVLLVPERVSGALQVLLVLLAAGFTSFHQSYLPIAGACGVVLLLLRWRAARRLRVRDAAKAFAPPLLAAAALVAANTVYLGKVSLSPYGKIFVLARLIVEGPGLRTLQRECPQPGWTLCRFTGRMPDNVEEFQFGNDGIVGRAGGQDAVAAQAGPIIAATVRAEPVAVALGAVRRSGQQFASFASGDWLMVPHPDLLADWRKVFPPAEVARFAAAWQQRGIALLPNWLQVVHQVVGWVSLIVLAVGAAIGIGRQALVGDLAITFVTALLTNPVVTGGLSGVYDRYQSRFMVLSVVAAFMLARTAVRPPASAGVQPIA